MSSFANVVSSGMCCCKYQELTYEMKCFIVSLSLLVLMDTNTDNLLVYGIDANVACLE